ncbi:MAG: IS630 transposase-related protein [Holosporales bacterium]|jgi:transposase
MAHGISLRERVVAFVRGGGSKAEAARRFQIGTTTVYVWLGRGENLACTAKPGPKQRRKIDVTALADAVSAQPDKMQKEHAIDFKVHKSTIHRAMKELRIRRKKNAGVFGKKIER